MHFFLSNFYERRFIYDGLSYPTSEHAYQAQKTEDLQYRIKIAEARTPHDAKKMGRELARLRPDWQHVKVEIMEDVLRAKFSTHSMKTMLMRTYPDTLIEGNDRGDTFWGVCNGEGRNMLGQLLMKIREEMVRDDLARH